MTEIPGGRDHLRHFIRLGEDSLRGGTFGSFAVAAGFRSIHSQRTAAPNMPDKIA